MYPETFGFSAYPQQQQPPPDAASCIYTTALPLIADPPDILGNMHNHPFYQSMTLEGKGTCSKLLNPSLKNQCLALIQLQQPFR